MQPKRESLPMHMNWLQFWEKRQSLREKTQAYRLVNGSFSGVPGLVVEIFGDYAVFFSYSESTRPAAPHLAGELILAGKLAGAVLIDRSRKPGPDRKENQILHGEVPERLVVREEGILIEVLLHHPQNVGLFLDTRPLRRILHATSRGHKVLNLFAYTCSLGLAASLGGAESVANVDVSPHYLRQGKSNYSLNGLNAEVARFHRMDAEDYLDWALRKDLRFDTVILDPPSFSRQRGKTYSFERDYFRLVEKCAAVLASEGRLFALTNYTGISGDGFRDGIAAAVDAAGKTALAFEVIEPPEDFELPASRFSLASEYAGALIFKVEVAAKVPAA